MSIIKFFLLFFVYFSLIIGISAQAPDTIWTKMYGSDYDDESECLIVTNDGSNLLCGQHWYEDQNLQSYVMKFDDYGDTIWTYSYGGSNNDIARWVTETSEGDYIVVGQETPYINGSSQVTIYKISADGEIIWDNSFSGGESAVMVEGCDDQTDGYVLTGSSYISDDAGHDIYIARIESDGDTLWTRTYGQENTDLGYSVVPANDNYYFVLGSVNYLTDNHRMVLLKLDEDGVFLWNRHYVEFNCYPEKIIQTSDGNFLILADGKDYTSNYAIELIKINQDGDTLWTNYIVGDTYTHGHSIKQLSDGGYIICGSTGGDYRDNFFIARTDEFGDTLWTKTITGCIDEPDVAQDIVQTLDGGYIFTGFRNIGEEETLNKQIFICKIAPDQVSVDDDLSGNTPNRILLSQNYPNPFNASTVIHYELPYQSPVTIDIYSVLGRRIQTLEQGMQPAGNHNVIWHAEDVSSGVYFYKIQAGKYLESNRMVLIK